MTTRTTDKMNVIEWEFDVSTILSQDQNIFKYVQFSKPNGSQWLSF